MLKVGKKAPYFTCPAVVDGAIKTLNLDDLAGRHTVLFFYPLDFTFVCPTELHAFEAARAEFDKRDTDIIGVSVDSVHSHLAWLKTPKAQGGIAGVHYPLISDIQKTMARNFGVLVEEEGVALRGLFILDKDNVVQQATINNLGFGRNVAEVLRLIDALRHHEQHGEVCPANWTEGAQALRPNAEGLKEYFG